MPLLRQQAHTWVPDAVEGFLLCGQRIVEGNNVTMKLSDDGLNLGIIIKSISVWKKGKKDECQAISSYRFVLTSRILFPNVLI
ncbi:hypothetical protein L596_009818 [Steinernema carpocapsae]|uniref:Uncharacterized protein n=1 Tax=Steinernema carpocapsae TaxID=34508 RepID=A0A4U5PGZ4_STECR|nr:hypothetical protein L596_009818 [Steinernema carpocapsae]